MLAHVARNADALVNLLAWARTGQEQPMYPSAEAREADIEAGAQLPAADLLDDLHASAARFTAAVMDMPDHGWHQHVRPGPSGMGDPIPGRRVLWLRLRELEIHHVDLNTEYGPYDWPASFVRRGLPEVSRMLGRRDDVPTVTIAANGAATEHLGPDADVTVKGPPAAVLAWLIGRSPGDDLVTDPSAAELPIMPRWL